MNSQFALRLVSLVLLMAMSGLGTQNEQPGRGAELQVGTVQAITQIYVTLRLRVSDQELFVPYCAQSEGDKILCTVGTHLEIATREGWRPAKLRTDLGVLGGLSLNEANGVVAKPQSETSFSFQFSRRFFKVDPGQRLRVAVDAWPDQESMRRGQPATQIVSPPFICP